MTSLVRTVPILLLFLLMCMPVCGGEDLTTALRSATGDGRPVLLLVRNPRDVATLDAPHWATEAPGMAGPLAGVHLVTTWNDDEGLRSFPHLRGGGVFLLNAQGRMIAHLAIPSLREQFRTQLEQALADTTPLDELAGRAEAGQAGDATVRRAWQRLVDAGQTERAVRLLARPENNALAGRLSTEVDLTLRQRLQQLRGALAAPQGAGQEPGRAMMREMLAERMDEQTALRCVGLLTESVVRWGDEGAFKLLLKKIEREAPRGRATARAALRAGNALAIRQSDSQTKDWAKLAERAAGNGESPILLRAALRQRWTAEAKDAPLRSRWRKREVLNVVVLVSDDASFVDAVRCWTEKTFFPVLYRDDLCAPRFIAAFKPSTVILLPAAGDAKPQNEADVRDALLQSWTRSGESVRAPISATRATLLERLRGFSDDPQGVVFTQMAADEWPGALALAAGRFEGLEFLPHDAGAETTPVPVARARELARSVEEGLAHWGLPREGHSSFVTLAGDFPLTCLNTEGTDPSSPVAVDDWVGRAGDGGRIAFTGRLTNGRVASAYLAACSLFLQPASATLVDDRSKAIAPSVDYDLAAAERVLQSRWNITRRTERDSRVPSGFGSGTWRAGGFAFIQTDNRAWMPDDVPAGEPCALVFTQPNAADDLGNLETLCGRALLGGAFWCAGSLGDGYLEGWPPAAAWSVSIRDGTAWGAAFRRDDGQAFGWPWRLVLCGDPLFCLRDEPARRREHRAQDGPVVRGDEQPLASPGVKDSVSPEEWRCRLQEARWSGDRASARSLADQAPADLDGPALVLVLEEQLRRGAAIDAWRRWSKADDEARRNVLAGLCARQAACSLMVQALAESGLENTLSAFDAYLLTGPSPEAVSAWLDRLDRAAASLDRMPVFARWLAERASDARLNAYRNSFQECARRIGRDALDPGKNGP